MTTAKEIMTREVISVREDTPITDIARLFTEKRISGVPVLNDRQEPVGIVSESDLIDQTKQLHLPTVVNLMGYLVFLESTKKMEKELKKMMGTVAREVMSSPVKTVHPDTPLEEIAGLMTEHCMHTIPVVEGGRLVGIIGKKDIVRAVAK